MPPFHRCGAALLLALPVATGCVPKAVAEGIGVGRTAGSASANERYATGWTFYVDNDYLSAGLSADQGYTGGFGLSLAGRRAAKFPWSLNPALRWIDETTGWASLFTEQPYSVRHAWQIGTMAFTPENTDTRMPVPDDRPYGGLVFIGNTRQVDLQSEHVSYLSNFTLGVIGTDIPEGIQNGLHDAVDDDPARGWGNQVSDGGELTFLWRVQRRQTHWLGESSDGLSFEISSVLDASVGYDTQLGAGITGRWGDFSTAGWSIPPDYASNITTGALGQASGVSELYLWGGVHVHRQLYNAFLEGQFRDSPVTFDREEELRSSIWEANIGGTWALANGYHVTLAVRARQKEVRSEEVQQPAWGSLIVGRRF